MLGGEGRSQIEESSKINEGGNWRQQSDSFKKLSDFEGGDRKIARNCKIRVSEHSLFVFLIKENCSCVYSEAKVEVNGRREGLT